MSAAARAIAALRSGQPVTVGDQTVAAVETATDALLALLDPEARAPLLISGTRAAALGLANQRSAADTAPPPTRSQKNYLNSPPGIWVFENPV